MWVAPTWPTDERGAPMRWLMRPVVGPRYSLTGSPCRFASWSGSASAPKFAEAFGDRGWIDTLEVRRLFGKVGFDGPFVYNHVPETVGDSEGHDRAVAFALGYTKALMAATDTE